MANFCGKCGTVLNKKGKCPKCGWKVKKEIKQTKSNKPLIIIAVILGVALISGIVLFAVKPFDKDIGYIEEYNVGEEIRKTSQVLETINVKDSKQVVNEKDTIQQFSERGFDSVQITTTYSMEGEYFDDTLIDESNETYHPLYYSIYTSDTGYIWVLYCNNGEWSAFPFSFLYSGDATSQVVVTETEYVMSYDSATNCFYKIIPSESECVVKTVDKINAETLDKLANEEFSIS